MIYCHYFQSSPDSTLLVEVYIDGKRLLQIATSQRKTYHEIVKAMTAVDREVNFDKYPEDQWSAGLLKAMIDITGR